MKPRAPLVAVAALALACLSPTQRREESLVREARTFNDDLRWGRYEQLSTSLPREEAELFLARVGAVGDELVLADYEVTSVSFDPGSDKATVLVKLDWYSKRAMSLRSTVLDQRWEHQAGKWRMTKQRRLRGDRFPLVTEPAPKPKAAASAAPAAVPPR